MRLSAVFSAMTVPVLLAPGLLLAQACPPVPAEQWYGPYDYTNPNHRANRLEIVERHHFTTEIEQHKQRVRDLGDNLDYTLKTFPNHHRALASMSELAQKEQTNRIEGMDYSVDCYFKRAAEFAPEDGLVHMVHGMALYNQGDVDKALDKLERAAELEPDNANVHYNYGLVLFENGDQEAAREHAERAYELGFPLPGLRNKLQQAGYWSD